MNETRRAVGALAWWAWLWVSVAGCGDAGGYTEPVTDEAQIDPTVQPEPGNGLEESPADPTPGTRSPNQLDGIFTGGSARVVAVAATVNGVPEENLVYSRDLEADCLEIYEPQGLLCDRADSPSQSEKATPFSGPSWGNYGGDVRGIVVIDACYDGSCDSIDFNEVRIFQSFPYSKVTSLRLYVHADRSDSAPRWNDDGWTPVDGPWAVGAGLDVLGDGTLVAEPTVVTTASQVSRHIRVDVANDGSLGGDPNTIDFRSIKLFSVSDPLDD